MANMRIIFLDDDDSRIKAFKSFCPAAEIVMTAKDTIESLKAEPTNWLFLDHDLRGISYDDSTREDCGMEVVRWVVKHKPSIDSIILHTCNSVAIVEMNKQLTEAGYLVHNIPFPYLFKRLKYKGSNA